MMGGMIKRGAAARLRRSLRQRRRPRSLAALVRLWWHDLVIHVLFEGRECCQDCGRGYVQWHAPPYLYGEVHGSLYGLLCPACFARQARACGIAVEFEARVFRRDGGPPCPCACGYWTSQEAGANSSVPVGSRAS